MLIHLVPRFLTCPVSGPHVQLIDLRIDSVGLLLRDRVDLATRRPMPNKHMAIGCSKRGRLARVGLLIDTLRPAQPFTVVYRWAVAAEQLIVHRVHYELLGVPDAYQAVCVAAAGVCLLGAVLALRVLSVPTRQATGPAALSRHSS